MHESIYTFKKGIYGWLALMVLFFSIGVYVSQYGGMQPPNGGTWQGYTLGVLATLIALILIMLGIRKRSYRSRLGTVQGWTSAHIYLGVIVILVATLHSAGQLGWNIHSVAYILMLFCVLSGFLGLYAYTRYPRLLSSNRAEYTRDDFFAELSELNNEAIRLAGKTEPLIRNAVESAINRTAIGGGVFAQLFAIDNSKVLMIDDVSQSLTATLKNNKDQKAIIDWVASALPKGKKEGQAANLQQLLSVICRRQEILRQIRKDIQLRAWLQCWLYIHIPVSLAMLVALALHIMSVFFFW